ncbi:ion channel protein [Leifsonia poae]|uniref:Ion-transport protein n=1 Tax=Leifsonia poae TaxID=110933 RepID=A0A9W6M1I1_9MICO|nr:ion channel protein [Leifsonia poae]GLJ77896.1 putative ion-transport protein [Leifsonia poae]
MTSTTGDAGVPSIRMLVRLSVPAVIIGVVSALVLWCLDEVAGLLEDGLWKGLPGALGIDPSSGWWIFAVLTATGVAIGLVVWLVPGHAGPDSATTELMTPPLRLAVLPSLILATVLALAGGVSLGPENPIIAINTGLLVAVIARLWPAIPPQLVVLITAAGTIGALFGTPVAAALVFTGVVAALKTGGALWDRLFLPLASATAGSITMTLLAHPSFAIAMPTYDAPKIVDLAGGIVIGIVATLLGLVIVYVFPLVHRTFHRIGHPLIYITLGGLVLGGLGALGGPITLFKGLTQMNELVQTRGDYTTWQLAGIVGVKVVALVIAAAAGFRGGRIFPAVFIGAAVGVLANALVPAVPLPVAVGCGVLGLTLAIARDGWIALFIAAAVTNSPAMLPLLCLVILPTWLMVSRAPEMLIKPPVTVAPAPAGPTGPPDSPTQQTAPGS